MEERKIKLCPFCGSEAILNQHARNGMEIKCSKCLIGLKQRTISYGLEWLETKLIERWNKRI